MNVPHLPLALLTMLAAAAPMAFADPAPEMAPPAELPRLSIAGDQFVNPSGEPVRFWGVNLVSYYPTHEEAEATARNLADLQFNLVRPHHLLRRSMDWNPGMVSGSLLQYKENSLEFEPEALDRFDYLNAALKRRGIYLAFSTHFSRVFMPGDVELLETSEEDKQAWVAALNELNGWHWKKSIDLKKLLPVLDERAARATEKFARDLMGHTNPYTGSTYAADSQVVTIEILNESSFEYAIVCGNRFPDYWQKRLEARWSEHAQTAGIEPVDLYKVTDARAVEVRAKFLTGLDEAYHDRIAKVVRETGSQAAITFSNLWRGDAHLEFHSRKAQWIENHGYIDPLVVRGMEDDLQKVARSALAGKPFIVGELNQTEGEKNIAAQSPFRTMLPLASAAYGNLNSWSGLVWFAWVHGKSVTLGADSWAVAERRESSIGGMVADGMMLDHMRTAGILFRQGLVSPSREPVTIWAAEPHFAANYNILMKGKDNHQAGWQNIHAIRRAFGPVPAAQPSASWLTATPKSPLRADTGEITKDIERQQLTVGTARAEAFSGYLDAAPPADLRTMRLTGEGFATVILVSADGGNLAESSRLILSRTSLDGDHKETDGPEIHLRGLRNPDETLEWRVVQTRPRTTEGGAALTMDAQGEVHLPPAPWRECELILSKKDVLAKETSESENLARP